MGQSLRLSSRAVHATILLFFLVAIVFIHLKPQVFTLPEATDIISSTKSAVYENEKNPLFSATKAEWVKPAGQKVIGLVFYGRQDRVAILQCFLERNLPEYGGWLDEVHFVRNTDNEGDLAYLASLVATRSRYKIIDLRKGTEGDRFVDMWTLLESNAIYVKIDDDVVFIADDTIPRLVTRKLTNPEYLVVSANVINSPLMSKVHFDQGAYHPYLPAHESMSFTTSSELESAYKAGQTHWEFTNYPFWSGPAEYALGYDQSTDNLSPIWLRLVDDSEILRTPASNVTYDAWGPGLRSWSIAAQSHLSFLENVYFGNMHLYYEALNELWFTNYDRLSINLIAVDSNEILAQLPIPQDVGGDEEWLTVVLPERLGKHVVVETRALAAHFSFGFQIAIEDTDLLGRYADFAKKKACSKLELFGNGKLGKTQT